MRISRIVANLMLAVAVFSAVARAQGVLTDDSFTSSLSPKTNYGTRIALVVSSGTDTYLKFSLANVPSGLNGNSISGGNVVLYVDAVLTAGTMDVYAVNGSWTQGSITYSNAPPSGSQILSAVPVTNAGFLSLNLTSTVQAWMNGTLANNGIVLVPTPGSSISVSFDSMENILTSHPAQLNLVLVAAGPQGPQGVQGPAGPQGATGATGLTGPQGPMGLTGAMGLMGPAGPQGPTGQMGLMGLTGQQGVQGPAGTNGVGFNFTGPFYNSTSYNVNDVATYNGSTYVAVVASQGAGTPDIDTTDWSLMAQQGATGPAGATGPPGAMGNPGPQGPTGAAGPQGPAGQMGPMGLTGPQGVQGPAGPGNTVTQVSNTAAGCNPGAGACSQQVLATCPSGTAVVGCSASPDLFCPDGSVAVIGTQVSGNSCKASAINHSPGGVCGAFVTSVTTTAQCLNVP